MWTINLTAHNFTFTKINFLPVAGNTEELSASAMMPIINWVGIFPDDTSVTTSEPADFDTVKLEEEKSTNVSVKKLENFSQNSHFLTHT